MADQGQRRRRRGGAAAGVKAGELGSATEGNGGTPAVDNGGEEGRRSFTIPEERRAALDEARDKDAEQKAGSVNEDAFWAALGEELGFNTATIQPAEDVLESGAFTAWPAEPADPDAGRVITGEELDTRIRHLETIGEGIQIDIGTLVGDVRDGLLEVFKHRPKPWSHHSPDEQRDVATALEYVATEVVRRAVQLIAADDRPSIKAKLVSYQDKGGDVTGSLKFFEVDDAGALALRHASGKEVLLITADSTSYSGQRRNAIPPDQQGLPFEAGSDVVEHPDDDSDLARAGDGDLHEEEEAEEPERELA